ncbi:hypothetical protein AB0B01_01455 [Streptomyces sp. NPDC044571]|uniref:hypothetical protein n=1 Tax=Streptomyces sp. NPDC044571 TaxID=3155371 RepID=UPI0033DEFD39
MAKKRKEPTQENRGFAESRSPQKSTQLVEDVREAQVMALKEDRMREQRMKGGRG